MSSNKGPYRKHHNRYRNDKSKPSFGEKSREVLENIGENNPIIQMFRGYASDLDKKHDKYERIIKLSRDITIESKRIIFLLHSTDTDIEHKKEQIFKEADLRLNLLVENNFKLISKELKNEDAYLYLKAYTAGMQEFIEALTFYQYLRFGSIEPWDKIVDRLQYKEESSETTDINEILIVLFPAPEYFLGLADFTGELMRKCINNLGSGNIEDCFKICDFVKYIFSGFLGIGPYGHKEIGRKLYVLRQSLLKMEFVCYNIRVRGSEIPKHMLANVYNNNSEIDHEESEGFF